MKDLDEIAVKDCGNIYYGAMSTDGYIASNEQNPLAYLQKIDEELLSFGPEDIITNSYANFSSDVDNYIMGRTTYEDVLKMGEPYFYRGKNNYVITSNPNKYSDDNVNKFINYQSLILFLTANKDKKNYIIGGGKLAGALLDDKLIDKIIITQLPILLGGGVKFFQNNTFKNLKLVNLRTSHDYLEYEYRVVNDREL